MRSLKSWKPWRKRKGNQSWMIKAGEKMQEDLFLREGERVDDLERNGYGIIQKKGAFCFGMDAVLLSGFAAVRKRERVLDNRYTYRALSPSCWRLRRRGAILLALRFRRNRPIWPEEASDTIIWRKK